MSKLVTKMLATGAAVSMLTLPGLAPVAAASLGGDSPEEAPAESTESAEDDQAKDTSAQTAAEGAKVQLLNITDFHGRIAEAGTQLASVVEEERAKYAAQEGTAGTGFLSAGDNIGASTYVSSSQKDTPTLEVLNAIGAQASAVGNHEFDQGVGELTGRVSSEADFPYLAANVYDKDPGNLVDGLQSFTTVDVGGVKIAVIGVVTKDTKSLVSPDGIDGLVFGDPTEAVNRVAGEIEALPDDEQPDMTVVEAHLGASNTESLEEAKASNAEFNKLVTEADASADVLFTGHTHLPYSFEAPVPGESERTRPVIEAGSYGEYVGQVQLEADADGNWTTEDSGLIETEDKSFDSPVVDEVAKIIAEADEKAKVTGSVVAGEISEDITRAAKGGKEDRGAESTLGNLVADALKDGVEGTQLDDADFGITNPGGLRTDLRCDDIYNDEDECEVTAAELSSVLPFANDHGVVTMRGSDVIGLFEEQWQPDDASRPFLHLGISEELEVVYDSDAAEGEHVKSVEVEGKKLDPNKEYRVATLSFLAAGGDNFFSFAKGDFELSGLTDFETWVDYFEKRTEADEKVSPDNDERQADLAMDVIDNGELKVAFAAPDTGIEPGESRDFVLNTTAEAEVPGPVDVSVDLPEGYTVSAADSGPVGAQTATTSETAKSETAKAPEAKVDDAAKTMTLESIPAGASDVTINVTAPADATGEVTVEVGLRAGDADWWDDNPLPLSHKFEATAQVGDEANATAGDDGGANGTSEGAGSDADADGGAADANGGDDGTADVSGSDADSNGRGASADVSAATSANADGSGADADGSKDGGDLPRTGFEALNLVAAALALIVAGSMAVTMVARRRTTV